MVYCSLKPRRSSGDLNPQGPGRPQLGSATAKEVCSNRGAWKDEAVDEEAEDEYCRTVSETEGSEKMSVLLCALQSGPDSASFEAARDLLLRVVAAVLFSERASRSLAGLMASPSRVMASQVRMATATSYQKNLGLQRAKVMRATQASKSAWAEVRDYGIISLVIITALYMSLCFHTF